MGRGVKKWTEEVIARKQREGRGQGKGASYSPWIHITDFHSAGRTHEPYSHKFGRTHQLLSDQEWKMFVMLEWAHDVVDVWEQFPLPRDITMEIAHALAIHHQYYPGTQVPYVMTIDFMVKKIAHGEHYMEAFNVKTAADLDDPRTLAILEVARASCHGMNIDHHLIIAEEIPRVKVKNLEWIRGAQVGCDAVEPYANLLDDHMTRMVQDMAARRYDGRLVDYCTDYDRRCSLERGTGLRVARMLMTSRALRMDLNNPHPELAHMDTFVLSARPGNLRTMTA